MARSWPTAGLTVRLDAVGNVIGRRLAAATDLPALMVGSHVDSVDGGGRFDGMLGVLGGIERRGCWPSRASRSTTRWRW